MLNKHVRFIILSSAAVLYSPSVLAHVSLSTPQLATQSALIGQLTHAWPITNKNPRVAVLKDFLSWKFRQAEQFLFAEAKCSII